VSVRTFLVILLAALLIYFSPLLLMLGSFVLTEASAKMDSQQNITAIIKDPKIQGAKIQHDKDSLSLSWEALSTPMINIKNASTKDLERLAKSVYGEKNYDRCVVKKANLDSKVEFYKEDSLIYTVNFTGD